VRDEEEIRIRVQTLVQDELTRRTEAALERIPCHCVHNYRHPLDARKRSNGDLNPQYNRIVTERGLPVVQEIGLCMLNAETPSEWEGTICDEPIDAKRCPVFSPIMSQQDVLQGLKAQTLDPQWVKDNVPEAHSLLWVLEEIHLPRVPWWKTLLAKLRGLRRRFRRNQVERLEPPFDSSKLLPPVVHSK